MLMSSFVLNTFDCYAPEISRDRQSMYRSDSRYLPTLDFKSHVKSSASELNPEGLEMNQGRMGMTLENYLWSRSPSDDPNTGGGGSIGDGDPDDPNYNGGMVGEGGSIQDGVGILLVLLLLYCVFIYRRREKKHLSLPI